MFRLLDCVFTCPPKTIPCLKKMLTQDQDCLLELTEDKTYRNYCIKWLENVFVKL
jgi:hypothetical protein